MEPQNHHTKYWLGFTEADPGFSASRGRQPDDFVKMSEKPGQ